MRKPIVAGQFYEGSKERLLSQISECYSHPFGAGKQERRAVKLMILPHAGYPFSGPCATQGYARLARPNKIILLGPSHAGFATCVSEDSWETPLGVVETAKISEKTGIPVDEYGHGTEHSLEVQIPFLQAMFEEVPPIVPVMVSSDPVDTGRRLSQVYETGDTIIVSSDFTHYGASFDYVPFRENIKEKMYELDRKAIDLILQNDPDGFADYVARTGATICGRAPIIAGLQMVSGSGELLSYYTSGDILRDYSTAVGYAAIAFY